MFKAMPLGGNAQSEVANRSKIMIIAGELSGDLHAAELIKSTLQIQPNLKFYGIGGEKMRAAGAEIIIDNRELAVVGIVEVLRHLKIITAAYKTIKRLLQTDPPKLLVLVDYPGFNLRIAKLASHYGIKVVYYISPQLWAWKKGRIKIIKQCIHRMMVIFPFEVEFYKKQNVIASFVGNSLSHQVRPTLSKEDTYKKFNLNSHQKIIGILPGSRKSEIKYIFPTLIHAVKQLSHTYPQAQFVLPLASSIAKEDIEPLIKAENLDIKIISNELYNVLQLCDAAICVSGTVTLEVALMGVPFIIIYKLSPISFVIGRLLVKVDMIGLCNIIAGKKIVPELIQHQATAETISSEIIKLIEDEKLAYGMRKQLLLIREVLSRIPDYTPAEIILNELSPI